MIFKCYWNDATKTTTNIHFVANVVIFIPENKINCNFSCGFAWIGMWGIFRQLYDVGILNFQTTHDLLWLYLAYIFPISSIFLPYTLNVPSFFLLSSYLLSTFFLPTILYLPKGYLAL